MYDNMTQHRGCRSAPSRCQREALLEVTLSTDKPNHRMMMAGFSIAHKTRF